MKQRVFAILLFLVCIFTWGCSSDLAVREVPGAYIPVDGTDRADTLFLNPFDAHTTRTYSGTYRHTFLDRANVKRIVDATYQVTDSVLHAARHREGALAVDLWGWHSQAKPNGFPRVLWLAMRRNDSTLLLPNYFYTEEEPAFVKVR